jgi:AGZA family xanthine/uracil permease-like MFS transporter
MALLMLERLFKLQAAGSSVRNEVLGGLTTFATMAYIIVVNPAILSAAGIPTGPSTVATILTAAFGCILMAFLANRPFAVAPYMGENAFIAFGLSTLAITVTWQMRLGTVFVAGALFLVLTLVGARHWLANSISPSLKHSFAVGIGLFLAFIGLYTSGIIVSGVEGMPLSALGSANGFVSNPAVPVKIGHFDDPKVLLAIGGFLLMAILMQRRLHGAILIGMAVTGVAGFLLGHAEAPKAMTATPFVGDYSLAPVLFQLDLQNIWSLSLMPVMLTLLVMAFLDTTGTLVGLGSAANLLDENGDFPDVQRPMVVDAITCMFAGLVGTSTSGVYIESATGIKEGAKTGLAALVVGCLFLAALFFVPLVEPLQGLGYAYGPALILVGILMLPSVRHIAFDDLTEVVPAFATIAMMVFTYNIANGLTAGLVLYPLMKLVSGRYREINVGTAILGILCLSYFLFGIRH